MSFSELEKLNRFINSAPDFFKIESIADIPYKNMNFPMFSISIGPDDQSLPTFALFAGVHGIEKIGSHLVLNYLKYLAKQLVWDKSLQDLFSISRLVTIPIVNPCGMYLGTRSNPNGVDIMRNAPIKGDGSKWNLVSGHSISPKLPWFKGWPGQEMEVETKALIAFVKKNIFAADFSFALDIHSGFGMQDRLWYPYSKTRKPFPLIEKALRTEDVFRDSLPYSRYIIEPQSKSYLINGDVWDYLFDLHFDLYQGKKTFIPWCLELGSWTWVKKNPLQGMNAKGYFNPILPHRYDRVMRRHRDLIDLFHRITAFHQGIF